MAGCLSLFVLEETQSRGTSPLLGVQVTDRVLSGAWA